MNTSTPTSSSKYDNFQTKLRNASSRSSFAVTRIKEDDSLIDKYRDLVRAKTNSKTLGWYPESFNQQIWFLDKSESNLLRKLIYYIADHPFKSVHDELDKKPTHIYLVISGNNLYGYVAPLTKLPTPKQILKDAYEPKLDADLEVLSFDIKGILTYDKNHKPLKSISHSLEDIKDDTIWYSTQPSSHTAEFYISREAAMSHFNRFKKRIFDDKASISYDRHGNVAKVDNSEAEETWTMETVVQPIKARELFSNEI